MQALYRLALDPIAETTGDSNSYGYRKGRAPVDALQQCWTCLNRKCSSSWVLEADIQSCFDTISHDWLMEHIPMEKQILRQWLEAGYMSDRALHATEAGVPQGGIISPVIANMTLDGLEAELRAMFPRVPNRRDGTKPKVNLIRFADDFVITGCSKELLETEVKPVVERFLRERGLKLSPDKTRVTHIDDGFDFLGQNIRKYNGKLKVKPSTRSVQTFLGKVRATIKQNQHFSPGLLILKLNPIIRGWANYHRHAASRKTFVRMSHEIFRAIWRWCRRRHPLKSARWVKKQYFLATKQSQWMFYGDLALGPGKKPQRLYLQRITKILFEKHMKIQAKANPYDPEWETYFEKRLDRQMLSDLKGKEDLRVLWYSQKGICPVCGEKISKETGWHSHHIVWKVYGGGDELANRVLLHPTCHRQVHSQGLSVEKPRLM